ncbi:hypothetical protein HBH69_074420 [Parastagonospora nodorum]|nr:hypothetical protein HBH69_074420 [Parastagonospora nodorum]KAH6067654.1 hypothetical protein HBI66_149110 [Parastagonospora nodorum]KAH6072034.1 hypothetical protein HBI67_084710 [Parastagonospora nodorum]
MHSGYCFMLKFCAAQWSVGTNRVQGVVVGNERRRGELDNSCIILGYMAKCGLGCSRLERHFKIIFSINNSNSIRGASTLGCQ